MARRRGKQGQDLRYPRRPIARDVEVSTVGTITTSQKAGFDASGVAPHLSLKNRPACAHPLIDLRNAAQRGFTLVRGLGCRWW